MAVRLQRRMLDHLAQQLLARQAIGFNATPARQLGAGRLLITRLERLPDRGEMVTELAESQRQVQHAHRPGQRPADR